MSELSIRNFGASTSMEDGEEFLDLSGNISSDTEDNLEIIDEDLEIEPSIENEPSEDNGNEELPEESSLTPEDPQPSEPEVELEPSVSINDEIALQYLSEKLGKPVSSFEDLVETKVENPLDNDPYLKSLYEWRQKTGRPIEDWYKYQKDYSEISDLEAARELLQHEYPTFTSDEINLELERYMPDELDDDREAAIKKLELKKLATRGREVLSQFKMELEKPSESLYSPEVKQDLELAKQVKENYAKQEELAKHYVDNIKLSSQKTDTFELELADNLKVNFKIPEQGKKEIPSFIETMPHWKNEDGSWNHQAVVNDAVKIKYFNDLVKLAYEQGLNAGKEDVITQTKNTNFNAVDPIASQHNNKKGVEIEGLDEYIGDRGIKLKF